MRLTKINITLSNDLRKDKELEKGINNDLFSWFCLEFET